MYQLMHLYFLPKGEVAYLHLISSLALYGNKLLEIKRRKNNILVCRIWSKNREEETELTYFLPPKDKEIFIDLLAKDKALEGEIDLEKL